MSFNIIATGYFRKQVKRLYKKYPSLPKDLQTLQNVLTDNPTEGTPLGSNCYKIRLAIASKGKGKRGGARVITYLLIEDATIFLLTIYDKADKDSISDQELKDLIQQAS